MIPFSRSLPFLKSIRSWIADKLNPLPQKIDLGLMRISPVDSPVRMKEQFIPLSRTTLIRKLSQDPKYINKSNETDFERLCRYLDACVLNRHTLLLQQVKTSYEHLNPDVELMIDGNKFTSVRRRLLDDEFWFTQKISRLLQLANFVEMTREQLEQWLKRVASPSVVQSWVEPDQYELMKVWLLGRDEAKKPTNILKSAFAKYWPLQTLYSPFRAGIVFRRVVVAVRLKKSDKVQLKMFKNLSEGELIHILPKVNIGNSQFDNSVLCWTAGLLGFGLCTHLVLPTATIASGWLLASTHQLTNALLALSVMVGLMQWHVIQQKKCHYWQWRSELNYQSIMANNRGVISLLADRAHEEIFKEAILSYVTLQRHHSGVSQSQLESEVDGWAMVNCDTDTKDSQSDIKIDLTESLSLLRQLHLVTLDPVSNLVSGISLVNAVSILGSEFQANNIVSSDGSVVMLGGVGLGGGDGDGALAAESYEKLRITTTPIITGDSSDTSDTKDKGR